MLKCSRNFCKLFYEKPPYNDFEYLKYPHEVLGFEGNNPIFYSMIKDVNPNLVLEIGSYKGQSSISMAKALCQIQHGHLICVDTWLGSSEFFVDGFKTKQRKERNLHLINGFPSVYYYFLANICYENLQDYVTPFCATSATALIVFKHFDLWFDLIYIDAEHTYNSFKVDLQWYDRLRAGGVLFGHDIFWADVKIALEEFCHEKGKTYEIVNNTFWKLVK